MKPKTKETEIQLNYNLHKSNAIYYKMAVRQMIRSFIKKCPKDVLRDVLKEEKIIKRDWIAKGEKYVEVKK